MRRGVRVIIIGSISKVREEAERASRQRSSRPHPGMTKLSGKHRTPLRQLWLADNLLMLKEELQNGRLRNELFDNTQTSNGRPHGHSGPLSNSKIARKFSVLDAEKCFVPSSLQTRPDLWQEYLSTVCQPLAKQRLHP